MSLFDKYPELGKKRFESSDTMQLISSPSGAIYEANKAFLDFIGYTITEFTRDSDPRTWKDISVKDQDLETDIAEADRLKRGEATSYKAHKKYITKSGVIHPVTLVVTRFPLEGGEQEFLFYIVEVYTYQNGTKQAFEAVFKIAERFMNSITELNDRVDQLFKKLEKKKETVPAREYWMAQAEKHPKLALIIILTLCLLSLAVASKLLDIPLIDKVTEMKEIINAE